MQVRILTLPFSDTLGRFDESLLSELCQTEQVVAFREHVFSFQGKPYVACIVEHIPRGALQALGVGGAGGAATSNATVGNSAPAATSRSPEQQAAFERIRAWRKSRAEADGVPPYVVLTNRELGAIIDRMPDNRTALGSVPGIGKGKLARYGDDLLKLIADRPIGEANDAVALSEHAATGTDSEATS